MSTEATLRRTWRQQAAALLDGDYPWGAVVSTSMRGHAGQRQLIVYPPGITEVERRWLRGWRGYPLWGGVLWFVSQVVLLHALAPWPATLTALGITAAAGAVACVMADETRGRVRTLNAGVFAGVGDTDLLEGQHKLRLLATSLLTAHECHRRGELTTVDYERIWWHVYNALEPDSSGPGDAHR